MSKEEIFGACAAWDLQVKIPGLERETSAQGTTHGNADISDNSEIIWTHTLSEEAADMRKLKIVEIKKFVGYS